MASKASKQGCRFGIVALGLALATGCGKSGFKEECSVKNVKTTKTVRGVFLHPENELLMCDDLVQTVRGKPKRGCELSFYPDEHSKGPPIRVFLQVGTTAAHMKPIPAPTTWQKAIHIVTDDGSTAELGDVVELTGELDTSDGNCDLAYVDSVKLIQDKYK